MESKIEIFTLLDKVCRPATILASNTSSLSVTEIASVTYRAPKCVGMHFFNPVHKMKLLEIVRALETDDETLAAAVEVGKRMGKEVVVIKESPGFITSRINAMIGNEAFYMLQEGVASAQDIDKALKLGLNHPMGPFEMVDLVGLDTRLHILEYLHKSLGEKFRPAPLLVQYVKAGRLGRKAGRGVYEYPAAEGRAGKGRSMKIVRAHIGVGDIDRLGGVGFAHGCKPVDLHRNHALLILQHAFQQQKLFRLNHNAVLLQHIGRDDRIADSGFIFQAEEDEAFGCARPLPRDHASGRPYITAMRNLRQLLRGEHARPAQIGPAIRHGMRTDREPGAVEVGNQPLLGCHGRKWRSRIALRNPFQQRPGKTRGALHLPQRIAAMQR